MVKDDIKQYSLSDLDRMVKDENYVKTPASAPTYDLGDDFWSDARIVMPARKKSIHLRVDTDVLDWFKGQGKGHLTRMNAVLRSYMEARQRQSR